MILHEIFGINFQSVFTERLTVIFGNTKINNWNALIEPNTIFFDSPSTTLHFGTRITQNGSRRSWDISKTRFNLEFCDKEFSPLTGIFSWNVTCTKWTLNEHASAKLVCLSNGFVKNCLTSTYGECEQTNRHAVIGAEETSFDIRSITDIRGNGTEWKRRHSPSLLRFCCTIHVYPS